jgi:hypothetical protein
VAVRKCPYCLASVAAGEVLAHSNDLACPGCGRPLEISPLSRNLAVAAGLVAGWAVWHLAVKSTAGNLLGWVLPVVYAFLAFSIIAPLILIVSGDLLLRELSPAPTEVSAEASNDGGHGASGAHH